MKILNLYAGSGGNRKSWQCDNVTAIELNPSIAEIYQDNYPNDEIIIADAHQYLLDHYQEFDFIWSSPVCKSHSRARFWNFRAKRIYPDLSLYEEIIFLESHFKGKYCVENVIPYYKPLIEGVQIGRHLFWCNFTLGSFEPFKEDIPNKPKNSPERNEVLPEVGAYILNCALDIITHENINQLHLYE